MTSPKQPPAGPSDPAPTSSLPEEGQKDLERAAAPLEPTETEKTPYFGCTAECRHVAAGRGWPHETMAQEDLGAIHTDDCGFCRCNHDHDPGECCTAGQPGVKCRVFSGKPAAGPLAAPAGQEEMPRTAPPRIVEQIKHVVCSACGWSDATVEAATGRSHCWRCGAEEEFTPEHVQRLITKRLAPAAPPEEVDVAPKIPGAVLYRPRAAVPRAPLGSHAADLRELRAVQAEKDKLRAELQVRVCPGSGWPSTTTMASTTGTGACGICYQTVQVGPLNQCHTHRAAPAASPAVPALPSGARQQEEQTASRAADAASPNAEDRDLYGTLEVYAATLDEEACLPESLEAIAAFRDAAYARGLERAAQILRVLLPGFLGLANREPATKYIVEQVLAAGVTRDPNVCRCGALALGTDELLTYDGHSRERCDPFALAPSGNGPLGQSDNLGGQPETPVGAEIGKPPADTGLAMTAGHPIPLGAPEAGAERFDCPGCGGGVAVDEDGCCIHCGRDAVVVTASAQPRAAAPDSPSGPDLVGLRAARDAYASSNGEDDLLMNLLQAVDEALDRAGKQEERSPPDVLAGIRRLLADGYGPGGGYYEPDQRVPALLALLDVGWGRAVQTQNTQEG